MGNSGGCGDGPGRGAAPAEAAASKATATATARVGGARGRKESEATRMMPRTIVIRNALSHLSMQHVRVVLHSKLDIELMDRILDEVVCL